jgi:hypothetical protein
LEDHHAAGIAFLRQVGTEGHAAEPDLLRDANTTAEAVGSPPAPLSNLPRRAAG